MSRPSDGPLLECRRLTKAFGGMVAVHEVSFAVAPQSIVGLIGPNGAGKTTVLNLISGVLRPDAGTVRLRGRSITGLAPHVVARLGVGRVLQIPRLFPGMTVLDNVTVGAAFGDGTAQLTLAAARRRAEATLELVGLDDRRDQPVATLTLQEKKLVDFARALAAHPDLVLVDEVMSGLNPGEVETSLQVLRRVRDERRVAIVWVEHVMHAIMRAAEQVLVLDHGRLIAAGAPEAVARDPVVVEAYLGVPDPVQVLTARA
ncbi:MAG: ABC transporter ATP-binding protein [Armatimonadota bacterium]|nr:ABC transporter ATP-binding protein [Armatimonadota bacterium]